jgi:hypothetical protein
VHDSNFVTVSLHVPETSGLISGFCFKKKMQAGKAIAGLFFTRDLVFIKFKGGVI